MPQTLLKSHDIWIFDLDNTLYPPDCDLFAQVDQRMGAYIQRLLDLDPIEARRIQKDYYVRYGTTLRGLMNHHDVEADDFLQFVHDIDVSPVPPNPEMNDRLAGLPGRKIVYTNGSTAHAERVLDRLGVSRQFDAIFDIKAGDYRPKPDRAPYDKLIRQLDIDPDRAVMVEDMARNLKPAAALGMATIWLKTCYEWGHVDLDRSVIHHEIDDLMAWLRQMTDGGMADET